jgi:hypothetical protein
MTRRPRAASCVQWNAMSSAARPITDSPWFWAYLFATAALIALALIGPKFASRQAQIEREFQGRQRVAQRAHGQQPSGQLSTAERTLITLRPLFLGLAIFTIVAWIVFWRTRSAQIPAPSAASRSSNPEP